MIFSLFWEGAFIRGGGFILKSEILGGVYSRRGVYSRKYGNWFSSYVLFCSGGHFSERAEPSR